MAIKKIGDFVPAIADLGGVGEGEDRPERSGDHLLMSLRDLRKQVPGVVNPASLPRRSLEASPDRCLQSFVGVGYHETDPAQAPLLQ